MKFHHLALLTSAAIAAGSLSMLRFREQPRRDSLLAENAALQAQTNRLVDLVAAQKEHRRLLALRAQAEEIARLRAALAQSQQLSNEVASLRRQIAAREDQCRAEEKAREASRAEAWRPGQMLLKTAWQDAGQASPEAAFKTYLWAVAHGDAEKLKQCAQIRVPPGYTNDYFGWELRNWQSLYQKANAVRLLSESRSDPNAPPEMKVEFLGPSDGNNTGAEVPSVLGPSPKYSVVHTDEGWKLDLEVPPKMTEIILSDDPAQRASQLAQLPPEIQKSVKAMPNGKRLVIREYGLH